MNVTHLIDLDDYSLEGIQRILERAAAIMKEPGAYAEKLRGKVLATLFYEPSTRTQMSFQTAALRLGGSVIGFDNPQNSSVSKGETLKDTIRIVSGYADLIAIRNPREGSARLAAEYSSCPVINAGDGGHLHPTQTLTDLVTLLQEKGRLDHLTVGLCGDLKNGRTVHSLIKALSKYEGNHFVLISTPELTLPPYMLDILEQRGCSFEKLDRLEEAMPKLDVLYMTRIQQERFASREEYLAQRGAYVLDMQKLSMGKADLKVLHPLPRVDEITHEVDDDPRAIYFKQAKYGMYARMALMSLLLEGALDEEHTLATTQVDGAAHCKNANCITHTEDYAPHLIKYNGVVHVCGYCDKKVK